MAEQSRNPEGSLERIVEQGPSSSQGLSPEQENAFVKELTESTSKISSPLKTDINKIFGKYGTDINDYAVCKVTESVHSQPLTIYLGKGQPPIKPELIPPKLLQDLGMLILFCEEHRAEIGIKTALGINIEDMKDISYFIIPKEEEFGDEVVKNVLERYEKGELNYRLQYYNEPLIRYVVRGENRLIPRQAIVFSEKGITIESKLAVYESIKLGKPITKSEFATRLKVSAQVKESFVEAEKGPPLTIPPHIDYDKKPLETGIGYFVQESREIKKEYVSTINRLLGGAGQVAYNINPDDPKQVRFFTEEYIGQSGKEKRELAIKGILDMQLTLEMRVAGKSIGDKNIGETGYNPFINLLDSGK